MTEKRKLNNRKRSALYRIASAVLLLSLALAMLSIYAAAEETEPISEKEIRAVSDSVVGHVNTAGGKISYTLPGIPNRSVWAHTRLKLSVNSSTLSDVALVMNGITYLPLAAFLRSLGAANVSYNSQTRTATASLSGLYISVTDGGFVMYANDRPLFSFSPAVVMSDGNMYVPEGALLKATGLKRNAASSSSISYTGSFKALKRASQFYREDEVLWLSRIISAEARGESLLGQIAVGNVIMNRVKSPLFPNTIWGVIFDRRYGIQFSPVANGTIYNDPPFTSVLAAKICLEGTSLSEDTLYFLNPKAAESTWIERNREYAYTILNHDFYK